MRESLALWLVVALLGVLQVACRIPGICSQVSANAAATSRGCVQSH